MRLTRGKLLKQHDWEEWQGSNFLQLDQYNAQGMIGSPVMVDLKAAVFHLVWTYAIKAVDGWKKARWACDGSPWSSQAKVLDDMPTAMTRQAQDYFTQLQRLKTYWYLEQMYPIHLLKHRHQSKGSIFIQITHSMNGGLNIKSARQYLPIMSYPFCWLCKDTWNFLVCGRSMQTLSSENWDSHRQCMNHACTWD